MKSRSGINVWILILKEFVQSKQLLIILGFLENRLEPFLLRARTKY